MEREFDCVECGRHVVRFGMPKDAIALCALCLHVPGWYADPVLRETFDPDNELDDAAIRKRVNPQEE